MTTLHIADDEQTFLDFMVRLLQKDHELLIARNWNEVLEKFESNLWRLNATILDVNMPGLSVDPFTTMAKNIFGFRTDRTDSGLAAPLILKVSPSGNRLYRLIAGSSSRTCLLRFRGRSMEGNSSWAGVSTTYGRGKSPRCRAGYCPGCRLNSAPTRFHIATTTQRRMTPYSD